MDENQHAREGADIFASDMNQPEAVSKIAENFENTTVFVTGGTGFIGKIFIEKLLRLSKTVKVFILIRPKKGKNVLTRFQEVFDGPNMIPLKVKNPDFGQQVHMIEGDCLEKDLGLSDKDKQLLIDEVNYVIHCAATVSFNQDLKTAAYINVRALWDLMTISKKMKNLAGFLHISTAFSFCYRDTIDEKVYEAGMRGEDLLHIVEALDKKRLSAITPELIKDWPNTYVFTKAIAEDMVSRHAGRLPIAILRPSVVIASHAEPVAGWADNFYGPMGISCGVAAGVIRVERVKIDNKIDIIPADYVTNAGFAILWDISQKRSLNENTEIPLIRAEEEIPIYNAVSSEESPISYRNFYEYNLKFGLKIITILSIWYPISIHTKNRYLYAVLSFFLQAIPAYLVDSICFIIGKERRMVKANQKIEKFLKLVTYFSMREWRFRNGNLQTLWRKLEPEDRRVYPFSMKNFDWSAYTYFYVRGIRVYLLKDPLETVPKALKKFKLLKIAHYTLLSILAVLGSLLSYYLYTFLCGFAFMK